MLDRRADIPERQHVQADVEQTAVQIHRSNQAIPAEIVVTEGNAHAQPVERFAVHAEQNPQTLLALGHGDHPGDGKHQYVGDQDGRADRRLASDAARSLKCRARAAFFQRSTRRCHW